MVMALVLYLIEQCSQRSICFISTVLLIGFRASLCWIQAVSQRSWSTAIISYHSRFSGLQWLNLSFSGELLFVQMLLGFVQVVYFSSHFTTRRMSKARDHLRVSEWPNAHHYAKPVASERVNYWLLLRHHLHHHRHHHSLKHSWQNTNAKHASEKSKIAGRAHLA